jgi:hypothetical protein
MVQFYKFRCQISILQVRGPKWHLRTSSRAAGVFNSKNILHVPSASKSLVSVHKLARDNDAFLEFHPNFFLIKEQRESFIEVDAKGAYIPLRHISLKKAQVNKSMESISRLHLDGIVG